MDNIRYFLLLVLVVSIGGSMVTLFWNLIMNTILSFAEPISFGSGILIFIFFYFIYDLKRK